MGQKVSSFKLEISKLKDFKLKLLTPTLIKRNILKELLDKKALNFLKDKKNLLAFSAGSDSTALFFMLLEKKIDFDIAIVNYKLRKEADLEVTYAKELAKKYNKKIFTKEVSLVPPSIEKKQGI